MKFWQPIIIKIFTHFAGEPINFLGIYGWGLLYIYIIDIE